MTQAIGIVLETRAAEHLVLDGTDHDLEIEKNGIILDIVEIRSDTGS